MRQTYELTVEFFSFHHELKIVNRRIFKVLFFSPPHYGYIAELKIIGKKMYVNPKLTYEAFQRLLAEHFKVAMINLKWVRRPPFIQDVISFEWKIKERKSSASSAIPNI